MAPQIAVEDERRSRHRIRSSRREIEDEWRKEKRDRSGRRHRIRKERLSSESESEDERRSSRRIPTERPSRSKIDDGQRTKKRSGSGRRRQIGRKPLTSESEDERRSSHRIRSERLLTSVICNNRPREKMSPITDNGNLDYLHRFLVQATKELDKTTLEWCLYNRQELLLGILSRLPVKSLLRFRCVSKSWRSLMDQPSFCRLHLTTFRNNRQETHLFCVDRLDQNCVVRCTSTFETTDILNPVHSIRSADKWRILCSLDGLALLEVSSTSAPKLVFWNPSIRRARILRPSSTIPTTMNSVDLGFGFSSSIQDYKHVRLIQLDEHNLHSIAIYTLWTGFWSIIQFQGGMGCSSWRWCFPASYEWQTVCFSGSLYFIALNQIHGGFKELVSFDLDGEVFACISLPLYGDLDYCVPSDESLTLTLLEGGSSLGLLRVSKQSAKGSIWVLDRSEPDVDSMCWTERYKFTLSPFSVVENIPLFHFELLYVKKNSDMLLQWWFRNAAISLNLETKEGKHILEDGCHLDLYRVCGYKESLVLLNG